MLKKRDHCKHTNVLVINIKFYGNAYTRSERMRAMIENVGF